MAAGNIPQTRREIKTRRSFRRAGFFIVRQS
jgi:hypothetical protein